MPASRASTDSVPCAVCAAADAAAPGAHGQAHDDPVPGPVLLHGHVDDGDRSAVLGDDHRPVEQVRHHQQLAGAALEPLHVHDARGEHDGLVLQAGHPPHRYEDAVPVLDLHDQAEDARGLAIESQGCHRVAHLAQLIAGAVEDADAVQPGKEDPGRGCHDQRLRRGDRPAP
jgi:hypothetical protein